MKRTALVIILVGISIAGRINGNDTQLAPESTRVVDERPLEDGSKLRVVLNGVDRTQIVLSNGAILSELVPGTAVREVVQSRTLSSVMLLVYRYSSRVYNSPIEYKGKAVTDDGRRVLWKYIAGYYESLLIITKTVSGGHVAWDARQAFPRGAFTTDDGRELGIVELGAISDDGRRVLCLVAEASAKSVPHDIIHSWQTWDVALAKRLGVGLTIDNGSTVER